MASINLDDDQINKAMQAAVLTAIGETGRAKIVEYAVSYLTKKSDYGSKQSPLMEIVGHVAREIAQKILTERMEKDEQLIQAVESVFNDAVRKALNGENREKLVAKLAQKMETVFEERY